MEGLASKRGAVRVMVVALMIIMGWQTCAVARLIRVGGSRGWQQNVNYADWSSHESFYVGDWLGNLPLIPFPF